MPSLYLWRKQLSEREDVTVESRASSGAFTELRLTQTVQQGCIEIVARNGRVVRIQGDVREPVLRRILLAVE